MAKHERLVIDKVGYWSEIKLDIIRQYAAQYSSILAAQTTPKLHHVYIDAFAGAGVHESKATGEEIDGSPRIAFSTSPPFCEYYFIDMDGSRIENLRSMFSGATNVHIKHGDCNQIMLQEVFPNVRFDQYRRGLCLLDPYGLQLNWDLPLTAGTSKAIDLFINFPIMDMNRNVFWHNADGVDPADIERMNAFWGDDTWRTVVRKPEATLFGPMEKKTDNETVAAAYQKRLQDVAKFKYVPEPLPMRNKTGAVVYYLYFASQKEPANKIISHIFDKFRTRGSN